MSGAWKFILEDGATAPLRSRLGHKFLAADVMERADVRMVQLGDGAGFALEAFAEVGPVGEMRRKNLDGNEAVEPCVAGFIHLTHTPSPYGLDDFIWT